MAIEMLFSTRNFDEPNGYPRSIKSYGSNHSNSESQEKHHIRSSHRWTSKGFDSIETFVSKVLSNERFVNDEDLVSHGTSMSKCYQSDLLRRDLPGFVVLFGNDNFCFGVVLHVDVNLPFRSPITSDESDASARESNN
jgi:hypothetical protein